MSTYNDFIFDGKLKENINGEINTLLNQGNVKAPEDDGVIVEKDGDDVVISSNVGLKIVDGLICVAVEEED